MAKQSFKSLNGSTLPSVYRRISKSGAITIPAFIRREQNIEGGDGFEIIIQDGMMILKAYNPRCVFCNTTKDVKLFKDKHVCNRCISECTTKTDTGDE
ncbi:AbrB/MazE/SpoVT family DNA-binding domain-containing protein [Vallitalea guaymasensis]|uniref:AbrB/MazE/SpoVT family DNA-binding domain-containing protein n=1 Tax=Vallitalea guaymasensis TaxID=1185412 RepID=UPI000DE3832C|nr:AbrB/MazE/SpoVT family DNA-binding domain-containing protein [Vallitalea guaymasensis]